MTSKEEKNVNLPKRYRKPNALKHGAFSRTELLPWEDAGQFEEILHDLIDQYQPKGALQQDCIRTIVSLLWRKRRLKDKRQLEFAAELERVENNVLWEHPPPLLDTSTDLTMYRLRNRSPGAQPPPREDYAQLLGFSSSLYRSLNGGFISLLISMLPAEFKTHLNEKVPKANYEASEHWVVALKAEVDGVLLPMVRNRQPEANRFLETAANFLTNERMLADLELEERLDAGIDRALKRLFSLKMADQLEGGSKPKIVNSKGPDQLGPPDSASADGQ